MELSTAFSLKNQLSRLKNSPAHMNILRSTLNKIKSIRADKDSNAHLSQARESQPLFMPLGSEGIQLLLSFMLIK